MIDGRLFREVAVAARHARARLAAALASGDAVELYCSDGPAAAAVTASIRAETYLALAAAELDKAARLALAAEAAAVPILLIAEPIEPRSAR